MAQILVVDDESNIRMMVRLALKTAGHHVETAADGSEALDKFTTGSEFDLVLLDQRMPGMEGLQVLAEMKKRDSHARVVMMTAFGTIDLAASAFQAGASDFLRKPFTTDTLRAAVQAALENVTKDGAAAATIEREARATAPFGRASINGFRITASNPNEVQDDIQSAGTIGHHFTVRGPHDETHTCEVVLPAYFIELVKAHADRENIPDAPHFWLWLCEEALANHLWQNAEIPSSGLLQVDELTSGLCRWVDAVLTR